MAERRLDKDLVERTILCYWCDEIEGYIAASPLFDMAIAQGDTANEALANYREIFAGLYEAYENGKLAGYNKPEGAGKTSLTIDLTGNSVGLLKDLADRFQCTVDEAVEYLVRYSQIAVVLTGPGAKYVAPANLDIAPDTVSIKHD